MLVAENLPLNQVLEVLVPLEKELGREINPTCFTPAELERRLGDPDSFVNRVLAQPVLPLVVDPLSLPPLDNFVRVGQLRPNRAMSRKRGACSQWRACADDPGLQLRIRPSAFRG